MRVHLRVTETERLLGLVLAYGDARARLAAEIARGCDDEAYTAAIAAVAVALNAMRDVLLLPVDVTA